MVSILTIKKAQLDSRGKYAQQEGPVMKQNLNTDLFYIISFIYGANKPQY